MIKGFRHRGLSKLFGGDPSRIHAAMRSRVKNILLVLNSSTSPRGLDLPEYRLHELKGSQKGAWSVAVSGNWRITFRFEGEDAYDVDLLDYH